MIQPIRALVRPVLTFGLVGAFVYAAITGNAEAVKVLSGPALAILGFWFGERSHTRARMMVDGDDFRAERPE